MNSASLELFKRALAEGTNIRFQKATESFTDTALCSDRHLEIMEKITNGTYRKPIALSSARIKIAAAIVAAMFLLSGCVMIYKDEIRGFIEHIYEEYIEITFSDNKNAESSYIEEIYELTYVPEGYVLNEKIITPISVKYVFLSSDHERITFYQQVLDNTSFGVDGESGYTIIHNINGIDVYCRNYNDHNNYLWNDSAYAITISSTRALSNSELQKIIEGIKTR